jgi:hypothetical protein
MKANLLSTTTIFYMNQLVYDTRSYKTKSYLMVRPEKDCIIVR